MNFVQTFKALSNPIRRSILELLKEGNYPLAISLATLMWQERPFPIILSLLKAGRFNSRGREKNFIYYELNTSVLEDLMVWLVDLKGRLYCENE